MQPSPPAHIDVLPEVKCEIGPHDWVVKVMSARSSEGDVGGRAVFNVVVFEIRTFSVISLTSSRVKSQTTHCGYPALKSKLQNMLAVCSVTLVSSSEQLSVFSHLFTHTSACKC